MASEKQQPAPAPEQQSPSPDQKKTVEQVITEMVQRDENPDFSKKEDRKLEKSLKNFKKNYDEKYLEITVDTGGELSELKDKISDDVEDNFQKADTDLKQFFDAMARKERVEDEMQKLPDIGDVIQDIETVKDLRELSVDTLIKLEDKYEGILLYAFTDIIGENEKVDFEHFDIYKNAKPGVKVQVNFHGNAEAESKLGAADLLPPAVRRITVYEDGDLERGRTSDRRIGLKGQNKEGTGFFNKDGYIPVYTSDVILLGGAEPSEKAIDYDFEKKYRKENGTGALDYDKYTADAGVDDQAYLEKLYKENPTARRRKEMTDEEIDALVERLDGLEIGDKVAKMAVEMTKNKKIIGEHCWNWVEKVYKAAGARVPACQIYKDLNYTGLDCGTHHAGPEMLARIRPGDWLYINNKNYNPTNPEASLENRGNHSVIFLEWIDQEKGKARVASCPGANKPGRVHAVNFNKDPVTYIGKATT